jgi:tetratricopeptide (TPR) repeat protein
MENIIKEKQLFAKNTLMVLLEKVPFFAMSIGMGLLSVKAQAQIGALNTSDANFTGIERFALGFYALFTYIWKAIVPAGLTNFYPYPLKSGDALPAIYYVFPFLILGLAGAVVWFGRKNKIVSFGSAFFVVNLLLLLQFIAVGGAIVSDRYSYIPYLGLFLIAGWFVSQYFERKETAGTGKIVLGVVVAYSLVLGGVANARAKTWYDSVTLWKDNIDKYSYSPTGYFYLGQEYYTRYEKSTNPQEQQMLGDSAMYYFNQSVAHKPDYLEPTVCIGDYQRAHGQTQAAKATYLKAQAINPKNEAPYQGLGVVYAILQQYDSSEYNFRKALSIKPNAEAESNLANLFNIEGKNDSSLAHYAKSIAMNPDSYIPYMNRAKIYVAMSRWKEAIGDYDHAIAIRPETGEPYFRRATCYAQLGDQAKAKADMDQAKARGFNGQ